MSDGGYHGGVGHSSLLEVSGGLEAFSRGARGDVVSGEGFFVGNSDRTFILLFEFSRGLFQTIPYCFNGTSLSRFVIGGSGNDYLLH